MQLLIIRHAEPDYVNDSLTEKGKREAALLAERLCRLPIRAFYISTMGRAQETALPTLRKMGLQLPSRQSQAETDRPGTAAQASSVTVQECDWLREFSQKIFRPDVPDKRSIAWDWLPLDWTEKEPFFDRKKWLEEDVMKEGGVSERYLEITRFLDGVLADHGYVREESYYRAEHPNRDIIAFFCHFGLESILLSHLLNVSPMIMWHHTCALPSSVTSLYTEERRQGIALFRMNAFGDTSHLYAGAEEPSFAARFCETWDNMEERHD